MENRSPAGDPAAEEAASGGEADAASRRRSPLALVRRAAAALVLAPGRSAAVVLTVVPYLWLGWYVTGTVLGLVADPIIGGDWLTLGFTCYALVFPLALAHRTLAVGLTELTQEYLVDIVALVWLTTFYVVWMLAREPVDPGTSTRELYGPVAAGDPMGVQWAAIAGAIAVLVVGLSAERDEDHALFRSPFRTALVTVPGLVTLVVLLSSPGPDSLVWPVVAGAFGGTLLAGVRHLPTVASGLARAAFVCLAALVWAVGGLLWVAVYRRPPPTRELLLAHVEFDLPDGATEPIAGSEPAGDPGTDGSNGQTAADSDHVAADGGRDDVLDSRR
ncbi:hypothetical protein [Haloglomus salinum]|jgi:hypothetical protein|uniref:hypothetical protein n=1 Tax=Haloglomus salinum TaxID=2962673 RepID=UPI0020C9BEA5|nr:hypothetical protein [Haloglomus salinum]